MTRAWMSKRQYILQHDESSEEGLRGSTGVQEVRNKGSGRWRKEREERMDAGEGFKRGGNEDGCLWRV
eukprot:768281-Hanusia_phi.AAC.5